MFLFAPAGTVPVLIYHKVINERQAENIFSCPINLFYRQMRYLYKNRFQTLFLSDLYKHLKFNTPIPPRSLVITFDDGNLDNWVFAYPVLKQFSLKATIFMTTDFVVDNEECRPTWDCSYLKTPTKSKLEADGYLSWGEMRSMLKSGLIDIQSHAKTHLPFTEMLQPDSKKENLEQILFELRESKRILEENLDKKIDFIAWPHGKWTQSAQEIAVKQAKYRATIITKEKNNSYGQRPEMIGRIYFGQTYQGVFPNLIKFIKFTSAIEKKCGSGPKARLFTLVSSIKSGLRG